MKVQPNALWEQCLQLIRDNVTEQQFTTWFKPITFEAFDAATNILLVQVPSPFVYEYLEENYVDLLSKVLTRIYGKGIQLKYRIVTDKAHNLTQDIQSETVDNVETQLPTNRANQSPTPLDVALQEIDPQLDLHKSFSNYIEGDSNKLPRSIGLSIAEHPNTTQFNPMFIYGPSGCGKTHLINAIGLRIKQLYPQKRVLYISARLFQVQYTNSVLNNTTNDFINFYQTIDVLIVDDIQEWMTATKTQDTFFHIFNHLFKNGKRIILASDRPPVELKGMNERLLTRFACGLIAELEKPNVQLCVDILNSKIKRDGLNIPDDVVQFIAQTANGSVRDLQGVINSLLAYSVVYNSNIDMRLAERVIKRSVKIDDEPLTLDEIIDKVCSHFNVTVNAVNSRSRKQEIVLARQVSMYLAQKHTKMPASRIGKLVGGRDHSTVLHSCSQIEKRLQVDKGFTAELSTIENSFKLKS
ncbi:chromosomal replication initiator protein DnaA [Prevotella intermedia]|uniref:Chromosomal replication initiator protein DnaA n=1 Tax=Prevotella intermedia TaxID=28131 RepID=A0AAJ3RIR0_PREIN|nr:chromosomal replication initiator protein DnaA [Prevotella intermedia]ATV38231.1 chromosomal replication initiator protein DnaA [Prevotella intermedia]PIK18052.1 chromosomal replication initiator protein DnaA [Prevotella intermedia]